MPPFTFKKIFWSYTFFIIPFSILEGFLALFHVAPIQFNDKPTYGWTAFVVCIVFTPLWAVLFSGLTWVALNAGQWLHQSFLKLIKKNNQQNL